MPPKMYARILETIPEDLEAMADLLDSLSADMQDYGLMNSGCYALGDIFSVQARAHMEIAMFILEEIDAEEKQEEQAMLPKASIACEKVQGTNNVILFPIDRVQ